MRGSTQGAADEFILQNRHCGASRRCATCDGAVALLEEQDRGHIHTHAELERRASAAQAAMEQMRTANATMW